MSDTCTTTGNNNTCVCNTQQTGEECNMPEKLLALAEEAREELLKEKIKAAIEKSCGSKMDEIAKVVAEVNHAKMEHMIKGKVKCEEYKQNIKQLLISSFE